MKELKLSENQIKILNENINQISFLEKEIQKLKTEQSKYISIICDCHNVDTQLIEKLDFEKKCFVLKELKGTKGK